MHLQRITLQSKTENKDIKVVKPQDILNKELLFIRKGNDVFQARLLDFYQWNGEAESDLMLAFDGTIYNVKCAKKDKSGEKIALTLRQIRSLEVAGQIKIFLAREHKG